MQIYNRLPKFEKKLDQIQHHLDRILIENNNPTNEEIYIIERLLIQLQIEWELFVRNIILDSATGKYKDKQKNKIFSTYKINSREQASHTLISLYNKRKAEPSWYITKDAIDAAEKLKISNYDKISLELGVTPWPLEDLRHIRNFIAHQSKSAALNVRKKSTQPYLSRNINIIDIINKYSYQGTKNYSYWISFIKIIAKKIVE